MNNPEEYDQQPQPDPMPSGQPAAASSGGNRNKLVIGGIALGAAVVAAGGFAAMTMLGNNDTNDDVALPKPNKTATSPTATPTGAPTGAPNGQTNAAPDPDATPLPTLTALSGRNPFLAPIVAAKPGTGDGSNAGSGSGSGNQGSNSPSTGGGETKSGRGTTTNTGTGSSGSGSNSGGTSGGTGTSNNTVSKSQLDQANAVANKAIADLAVARKEADSAKNDAEAARLRAVAEQQRSADLTTKLADLQKKYDAKSPNDPLKVPLASEVEFLGAAKDKVVVDGTEVTCKDESRPDAEFFIFRLHNVAGGGDTTVKPSTPYCVAKGDVFVNPNSYAEAPAHVLILSDMVMQDGKRVAKVRMFNHLFDVQEKQKVQLYKDSSLQQETAAAKKKP